MRWTIHAVMLGALAVIATTFAATAEETAKSRFADEPRLGLGADIPDDLLFADPGLGASKPRSRVGVRRASPKIDKSEPITSGWDNIEIEIANQSGWQASEPVRAGCLDGHAIMSSLAEAGWSEFSRVSARRLTLAFNARRRDGRTKRVQVDRCNGEIIHVSAAYTQ